MKTVHANGIDHPPQWKQEAAMQEVDSILEYGDTACHLQKNPCTSYEGQEPKMGTQSSSSERTVDLMNSSVPERHTERMNKLGANCETDVKVDSKSKLNPKAEQFHVKGTYAQAIQKGSLNSAPNLNLNSSSQNSSGFKTQIRKTNLEMSEHLEDCDTQVLDNKGNSPLNAVCNHEEIKDLLKRYVLKKCSLNSHCNSADFDGTALDGLTRLSFVQSLQAVEHYGASVSERIVKKSAYLMGIIRGQESHWENSRAAAQLEGGSLQLLHLPKPVLSQIGRNCLEGNCLPSDFTPEVILSLHSLTADYALKAIGAFDSNKRIVAGCKGGVVNRPRFLQRLIENVIQQNPISLASLKKAQLKSESMKEEKEVPQGATGESTFSSPKSFLSLLGSGQSVEHEEEERTPNSGSSANLRLSTEEKMKFLERELTDRIERERRLRQELGNLRVQVGYWEKECHRLNSTITHILHNRH